jgi:hypothetical protein
MNIIDGHWVSRNIIKWGEWLVAGHRGFFGFEENKGITIFKKKKRETYVRCAIGKVFAFFFAGGG